MLVWRVQEMPLTSIQTPGFDMKSQAAFSGLILGDAVVDVNGENIESLSAQKVSDRLSGPMGTQVSLGVSRIISNFKTYHVFILTRDVRVEVPHSPITDPIDSALPFRQNHSNHTCEEPRQTCSEGKCTDLSSPHVGAPAEVTATAQDAQWSVTMLGQQTPRATTPPLKLAQPPHPSLVLPPHWGGGSLRASLVPSPRGSANTAAPGQRK
jgi:hypothetical protein